MKKIFNFKDDEYTFKELFQLHNSGKNYFSKGEVVDNEDGCEFDISEIYDVKEKYYEEIVDISKTLEDYSTSRMVWAMNQNERENKIKKLNAKYDNGSIKLQELELLLKLEKGGNLEYNYYVMFPNKKIGTFYKKYHGFKYPETLSTMSIGRLHLLLDFMTYDNEIKRTSRNNSNHPTSDELIKFMRVENKRNLNRVLKELKDHNIIDYKREKSKKIIYINPLFSDRNLKIHPEIYRRFKDDLDKVLDEKEIRYLELLTFEDDENGLLIVVDE